MRLLHVISSLDQKKGGPVRAVLDLTARTNSDSFSADVLSFGTLNVPDNPLSLRHIHMLPLAGPQKLKYSPALSAWLQKNLRKYDGVVLHGMWEYQNWAVSRTCARLGVPYACFPHGMLDEWAVRGQGLTKLVKKLAYWQLVERGVASGARAVLFTTEREVETSRRMLRDYVQKCIVVPYGFDNSQGTGKEPANPALVGREGQKTCLFLSRLHPKKNIEFLLRTWKSASPGGDWRLVIAGSGEPSYVKQLRALTGRLGLEQQVQFVGAVAGPDKAYLFGSAQWFVLPSKQENFGIVVLEAVAAGCPVVISPQVCLSDYLSSKSVVLPLVEQAWVDFFRTRMPADDQRREILAQQTADFSAVFDIRVVAARWRDKLVEIFTHDRN